MTDSTNRPAVTISQWLLATVVGLGLSLGVWSGLVSGGGLVGGDTYTYFMPQKAMMAAGFAESEIPLWHNLTGLGYPLHAESQAGVFYPTNQLVYRLFGVNTAYNISILLHYWLAFVFAWRFARSQGVSMWPALLSALIYVYGWFPARISLEWSIIGGVWLPLTLWQTERLLERPCVVRFAVLSLCLGVHLLAGHFALAFINQLTILAYATLRLTMGRDFSGPGMSAYRRWGLTALAILTGLCLASVQLVPTYELKQVSQRENDGKEFDPAYGHMPPVYVSQLVASWWYWHTPEIRASRQMLRTPGAIAADTNAVEAHLYWGLIPLALICGGLNVQWRPVTRFPALKIWLVLSTGSIVYATGWLLPVTRFLPGFNFFMGPARYTIVAALGGGLAAGLILSQLTKKVSPVTRVAVTAIAMALTLTDLMWSSRGPSDQMPTISDAVVVQHPPLAALETSWLRRMFADDGPLPPRVLAPGPNVCNLLGVSCVPQYLGIGPAVYFSDEFRPPGGPETVDGVFPDSEIAAQLDRLGVSNILTLEPIQHPSELIEPVQSGGDSFLNAVWARGSDPCFLYRLNSQPQRVTARPPAALTSVSFKRVTPGSVELEVDLAADAELTLKELNYPGWQVSVDGVKTVPVSPATMRSVNVAAGRHTVRWFFAPRSFQVGMILSIALLTGLLALMMWSLRRNQNI